MKGFSKKKKILMDVDNNVVIDGEVEEGVGGLNGDGPPSLHLGW